MFDKLTNRPTRVRRTSSLEVPQTIAFLTAVRDHGARLSYGALAIAARTLKEDSSTQIPAQRGSTIVKSLPVELQPYVCRKQGGYAKGVTWEVEVPGDLEDRPVILAENAAKAVREWQKATA